MEKVIVAPSVLSLDYAKFNEQVMALNESKAEWLHFDVMDGHFVPNLSFGPQILKGFKKTTDLFLDVHLMVDNPSLIIPLFIDDADLITFHIEVKEDIDALIKLVKDHGKKVGISIKPNTDLAMIKPYLDQIDLVLVMSVEPGFGGQSFIEKSLERIQELRKMNNDILIEVDGGINEKTGLACVKAGADVLVAGSYIFKKDIKEQVETLWLDKQ